MTLAHETQHLFNYQADPSIGGTNADEASAMTQNYLVMMAAANDPTYAAHAADLRYNASSTLFFINQLSRNVIPYGQKIFDPAINGWALYPFNESVAYLQNVLKDSPFDYLFTSSTLSSDNRTYTMNFKGPSNQALSLNVQLSFKGDTPPANTQFYSYACSSDGSQCVSDYKNAAGEDIQITTSLSPK
jgi:hypothetical protein